MLDLFRLVGGIDIQNEALTSNVYILQGNGVPGGDSSVQDAAPIGSLYSRTDAVASNLQQYYKKSNTNSSADWALVADTKYVDNAVAGISWREPVVARDGVATVLPTATVVGDPIVVDGVTVTNGQRVLFNSLLASPNVYVFNQATGSFVEDINLATAGDALFVTDGTSLGNRWTFNGTEWVLFGAETDVSEIVNIDNFLGKALGINLPAYDTQFVVTNSQTIQTAISKLDAAFGNGSITNTGTNYVISSALAFTGTTGTTGGTVTITAAIDALNTSIGNRNYSAGDLYFPLQVSGETISASLEKLNVAVHDIIVGNLDIAGSIATTPEVFTQVDSIPLTLATEITWMIQVRETATPANRRASEVHAITDGTNVDFTRFAELKLGAGVTDYGINVVVTATDITLQLKALNGYDYVVKRVAMSSF